MKIDPGFTEILYIPTPKGELYQFDTKVCKWVLGSTTAYVKKHNMKSFVAPEKAA